MPPHEHATQSQRARGVLMYHDVLANGRASGFASVGADPYKLDVDLFARHIAALAQAYPAGPQMLTGDHAWLEAVPFLLTFDDGGVSAATEIAPRLEALGWRGHFFITTDRIDNPGFLSARQIRALHARGHVIGTHSVSHPPIMSALSDAALRAEWQDSVAHLVDIIGAPVQVAAVPGGYHSARVAAAAAEAGIRFLFTSEPSVRIRHRDGLQSIGRYAIQHTTTAAQAVALAGASRAQQLAQWSRWRALELAKAGCGAAYPRLRNRILQWRRDRTVGQT